MKRIKPYNTQTKSFAFYRMLPGIITIILITSPVWTSLLGIYEVLLVYLSFISVFVLFKGLQRLTALFFTTAYQKRDEETDWVTKINSLNLKNLPNPQKLPKNIKELYHLVFIPTYKEPLEYLRRTIKTIANQDYPYKNRFILVLACEQRAGPERYDVTAQIKKEFKNQFYDIWDFYHPYGIPGEIMGDACANLRWAGIESSKKLHKLKINPHHVIFTKSDSDGKYHPKHFSALTYKYLTDPDRYYKFFSAGVLIYSNNYWDVPALTRVFSSALTLGVVAEWIYDKGKKQSFSNYSATFHLLEQIDFWDASLGAEDTFFYWNAFLHLNGKFSGEVFYLPLLMDCVEGKNTFDALKGLYKQQIRWGWGAIIMSVAIQGIIWNRKIPLWIKIEKAFGVLARVYNIIMTFSILMAFTIPILNLFNQELEYSAISYNLPRISSYLMTFTVLLQIPGKYFIWKYFGAPPKEKSIFFKAFWWTFEPFLELLLIWTYYLLPRLQAQFEMFIGKKRVKFFAAIEGKVGDEEYYQDSSQTNKDTKNIQT
ncbi:glycosyltransferase family 2 protein [Candidatus Dojkabacteria bacterium]|nr:glycosyltransferase family 2 protein [Candidatus Dojkabacteria bacterium]